ncbi:hypothetical protein HWV62_21978 [Athelia sp. TMB]|nr:hypothetical protein HWV62_21978 [Athelia sp. TMB]
MAGRGVGIKKILPRLNTSLQDFHVVISGFCKGFAGDLLVEGGDYRILKTDNDEVIKPSQLSSMIQSGMTVEMSIELHQFVQEESGDEDRTCPRCDHVNVETITITGWMSWQVRNWENTQERQFFRRICIVVEKQDMTSSGPEDDHYMSSPEVHNLGNMSALSFATVDEESESHSLRHRGSTSLFGTKQMASTVSSLHTDNSFYDFPISVYSSSTLSASRSLVQDQQSRRSSWRGIEFTPARHGNDHTSSSNSSLREVIPSNVNEKEDTRHQESNRNSAIQNDEAHHQAYNKTYRVLPKPAVSKDPIVVVGIPSVFIQDNKLHVGNSKSTSARSFTHIKVLGDGLFSTVWLCDWHGMLPPNTPLSPMQCGAGARPAYTGKRLVVVKKIKARRESVWDECKTFEELEALREVSIHPNIIQIYDFFLIPESKDLFFVFEAMEGNLYQLIKARKGRALAGGLVVSIFRQIASGLFHMHTSGYFHHDMKPENILVTTTGLFDYQSGSPNALLGASSKTDVVAVIKIADFGLARETGKKLQYTECVSSIWYRAPEILLLDRDYMGGPVDMWALGAIMAELVNLRPLFPGSGRIDQMVRICELMGDPTDSYGMDARGRVVGGGKWTRGVEMAKAVDFTFPQLQPRDFHGLFDSNAPPMLIDCISDLLKYDPEARLTSLECMEHPYILETIAHSEMTTRALHTQRVLSSSGGNGQRNSMGPSTPVHRSHPNNVVILHSLQYSSEPSHRPATQPHFFQPFPYDDWHSRAGPSEDEASDQVPTWQDSSPQSGSLGRSKKRTRGGFSRLFGRGEKIRTLASIEGIPIAGSSTLAPSFKQAKYPSAENLSPSKLSPVAEHNNSPKDVKKALNRMLREREKQRRAMAEKAHREMARAVMQKRQAVFSESTDLIPWGVATVDWLVT